MSNIATYELRGSVAVISLNRPEKRNALSRALVAALHTAFERAANDDAVRCVILTGTGPAFCAGMDLEELRGTLSHTPEDGVIWEDAHNLSALYERIYTLPKPTIAAINGAAVAGGAGLMTVCDLAVAVPDAKIGYPEVRRGLVAAMVLPHLLRHVGERAARWLLLTGEMVDAVDALKLGLVNSVASAEELMNVAMNWSQACAAGGPKAIATTKELLRHCSQHAMSVSELATASAEPRLTDECRGGLQAFFDKKPSPWTTK